MRRVCLMTFQHIIWLSCKLNSGHNVISRDGLSPLCSVQLRLQYYIPFSNLITGPLYSGRKLVIRTKRNPPRWSPTRWPPIRPRNPPDFEGLIADDHYNAVLSTLQYDSGAYMYRPPPKPRLREKIGIARDRGSSVRYRSCRMPAEMDHRTWARDIRAIYWSRSRDATLNASPPPLSIDKNYFFFRVRDCCSR